MLTVDVDDTDVHELPVRGRRFGLSARHQPMVLLVVVIVVWLVALPLLRQATDDHVAGQYGLLPTTGGTLLLVSLCVALIAFLWAVAVNSVGVAALAIVGVTLVERVTATLITDLPLYVWTYRHIGIVEFMIHNHESPHIQIYGDWPSFFATMAWFSTISGLDPVIVAHWFAPVAALLIATLIGVLTISAGFSVRAALVAAMLAAILNWTGQDYYSPQAVGFILALTILSLLLYSRKLPLAGYISIPLFAVFAATHQLTPVWLCLLTIALAVFNQIAPRWLALVYAAILATYVVPRLGRAGRFDLFTGFNPFKNTEVVAAARGSDGREFTTMVDRGVSVTVWLLALLCFFVIWRKYGAPWALALIAFSSMAILAGQNYGGEAIIRVYLYSLAGATILLAVVIASISDIRRRVFAIPAWIMAGLLVIALGAGSLQGYYGGWSHVTVTSSQLEQSRGLPSATQGRFIIGTLAQPVGWPEGSTAEQVSHKLQDPSYDAVLDSVRSSLMHKKKATAHDVDLLESALPKIGPIRTLYIILPRQAIAYGEYLGWYPVTFIPSLIERISKTEGWSKVSEDDDTVIFAYVKKK